METKKCTKCLETKTIDEFHKKYDGRMSHCKECKKKYIKEYNKKNREKINARQRLYNEENKDRINEKMKQYHYNNRDEILSKWEKKRRLKGQLTISDANKLRGPSMRGDKHPNWKGGVSDISQHIRSSTEYSEWRFECMKRDGFKCAITGKKGDIVVHHLQPVNSMLEGITKENFRDSKELFCIDNGITLDRKVHKSFHGKYGNYCTWYDMIKYMADLSV